MENKKELLETIDDDLLKLERIVKELEIEVNNIKKRIKEKQEKLKKEST